MPVSTLNTKHYQLTRKLRNDLKAMPPGQELPTQREVMKKFGASQATVERAIRRLCDEGLIHRPAGRKRLVVQETADPATLRICLIRPDYPSSIYDAICRSIAASGRGRDWAFGYVAYRTMEKIDFRALANTYDAAVLLMSSEAVPEVLSRISAKPPVPIILAQDFRDGLDASSVCIDDRMLARMVTRHLLDLGHARPAIAVPARECTGPILSAIDGWRQALEAAGLHHANLDELIIDSQTVAHQDCRMTTYDRWLEFLRHNPPPSAVFCASTAVALGVLRALRESGFDVPHDVSVASSDAFADDASFMSPPLTATTVEMSRFGEAIAQLIDGQTNGTIKGHRQIWIDGDLVVRQSTAPFSAP